MAHQGPSSAEVSSSHGGSQHNGDHYFLIGEEWSRRILVATHLFLLDPHHYFQFSSFLNCSTIYYFWQFSGPKLSKSFWGPKRRFFGIEWSGKYEFVLDSIFGIYGCSSETYISNNVSCTSNEGSMLKLRPREIDVPSYPTRPTLRRFTS